MSTLEVNTINPQSGTTVTIGGSGDTVTLGSGATQSGFGGVNTPSFLVYRNSTQSISSATYTKVQFNAEDIDTDNAFDSSTNYRFTVPSGKDGKYFIFTTVEGSALSASQFKYQNVAIYKNGSVYINHIMHMENSNTQQGHGNTYAIMDLVAGDYLEVYSRIADSSGSPQFNGGLARQCCFGGYRMVE
jgi:hypothetical protein